MKFFRVTQVSILWHFQVRGPIFQDSQTLISSQNELALYLRKIHNDEQIFTK